MEQASNVSQHALRVLNKMQNKSEVHMHRIDSVLKLRWGRR